LVTLLIPSLARNGIELRTFITMLFLYHLVLVMVDGWVLWQKGRRLFNLFYILLGIVIGQIIFLCMANKKRPVIKGSLESLSITTTAT
jgi:hypothetical protein